MLCAMRRVAFILLLTFLRPPAGAADAEYVPARNFAAAVEKEIDAARTSVHLYLYLFSYHAGVPDSPPARLARALIRARERGVRVETTLNGSFDPVQPFGAEPNAEAAAFLAAGGVDVYASSGPLLHAKLLVVDGRTVLLGSANWSATAFNHNAEGGAVIRSTQAARRALEDFKALPRRRVELPDTRGFPVPAVLLEKGGAISLMVNNGDDRSLDVYLLLLRKKAESGGASVVVNREALARDLSLGGNTSSAYEQIRGILRRLRDRYKLIEWTEEKREDHVVTVLDVPGPEIRMPAAYAEWGWDRRLSMRGKVFCLMGLRESSTSSQSPRWSEDQITLSQRYGLSEWFLSFGLVELRRARLLEVEYGRLTHDTSGDRHPNIYTPRPFYDPAVLETRFREMEEIYGKEAVSRARGAAAEVYSDSDVDAIERLIVLEERLGREAVDDALTTVKDKSGNNPKRSMAYLIGILQSMGREVEMELRIK